MISYAVVGKRDREYSNAQSNKAGNWQVARWLAMAFCILCMSSVSAQQGQLEAQRFVISAASIEQALVQIVEQSGHQLIMQGPSELHSKKIEYDGVMILSDLLGKLLSETTLQYEILANNIVLVNQSEKSKPGRVKQTEPEKIGAEATKRLDEIVVLAQKREQDILDVPLSTQVLSAKRIDAAGLSRIDDIGSLALNVTFSQKRGFDQSSLRIRGVGTQALGAGVEPSVATVVDGVVMAPGGAQLNELPDIERIEILNGPQATLYGKNSSAGVINIITKQPNTEAEQFDLSASLTSDKERRIRIGYNRPLSKRMAYRLSGVIRGWDGNTLNRFTSNYVDGMSNVSLSAKLGWLVSDRTSINASADYSRQNTECCARIIRDDRLDLIVDPSFIGLDSPIRSIEQALGFPIVGLGNEIAQNRDPIQDSTNFGASLEFNHYFGEHRFTSLTSLREWRSGNSWDNDLLPLEFHNQQISNRDSRWFSQEFRLASPANQTFDYLLGAYIFRSDTDAFDLANRTLLDQPIRQIIFVGSENGSRNSAIFGHSNWYLSDKFKLFGGFRLLRDSITAIGFRGGQDKNFADELITDFTTLRLRSKEAESKLVGKVGAQYFFDENINVYAFVGTGYKGRSFGIEFGFDPDLFIQNGPAASEQSVTIEVGLKGMLLNDQLRLSIATYNTIIDDLQIGLRDLTSISNVLGSVPETVSRGVEFNFETLIDEHWSINGGVGFNRAFYSDFPNGLCYLGQTRARGCVNGAQNLTGSPLENAPEWGVILNSQYQRYSSKFNKNIVLRNSLRWQSSVFLSDDLDPSGYQGSVTAFDFSIGLSDIEEQWEVGFFIKNLFNKHYAAGASANSSDGGGVVVHTIPRDYSRYAGLSVKYAFGEKN